MRCSLITDNLRQAEFVQKGLQYEHIPCTILSFESLEDIESEAPFVDGFFFLSESIPMLEKVILLCRNWNAKAPQVLLSQRNSPVLHAFAQQYQLAGYAARPFSFRQIAAEMKMAIFETKECLEQRAFVVRDLAMDLFAHQVQCGDQHIRLRNKEFALLHYMMEHKGKVLSRSEILENVWDRNAQMSTNTVDVHVSQLRKKLSACSADTYIHTVPCKGYFLA